MDKTALVEKMIDHMTQIVRENGLELMANYPNDLIVHDRSFLTNMVAPGFNAAWVVGDLHTHIVSLGLAQSENEMCEFLTTLSSSDKYFLISVKSYDSYRIKELTRSEFSSLPSRFPVKYDLKINDWAAQLFVGGTEVGKVVVEPIGGYQDRSYEVEYCAHQGAREIDLSALKIHASKFQVKKAGSLFCKGSLTEMPRYGKTAVAA